MGRSGEVHVEGLSRREAARRFGIDPRTVAKMLAFWYRRDTGGAGRRRGRSWTGSSGSSIGSWKRIKHGPPSSSTPPSGSSSD